ncbi:MAG TPA: ABC transporter permease [Thermoanaerobaculia bacterium]|nr:ABC transporter permease [Thermoanaerobaculia bacterium]
MTSSLASKSPLRLLRLASTGALHGLRRERKLSMVVVVTLGLAFAGVSLVINVVDRLYLRPLPGIPALDRIDRVSSAIEQRPDARWELTWSDWNDLRRETGDVFEAVTGTAGLNGTLLAGDEPRRVVAFAVDADYFGVFGLGPQLGRLIDRASAADPVAVLGDDLWRSAFGADRSVIGRSIRLNGRPFTVVGVAPRGFRGSSVLRGPDLWVPLEAYGETAAGHELQFGGARDRTQRWLTITARRAPGVSLEQARARLDLVASQLDRLPEHGNGYRLHARPLVEVAVGSHGFRDRWITMFAGVVALVLIAACSNVGGLATGKLLRRLPEIAVRLTLGESRGVLVSSLIGEIVLLALAGAAVGIAAAALLGPLPSLGPFGEIESRPRLAAAAATLGISFLSALLIALIPAWRAARRDLSPLLRAARSSEGGRRVGAREILVAAQVAICFLVLIGAVLTHRTVRSLRSIPLGFEPGRLVIANVDVAERRWDTATTHNFFRALVERLERDPAIENVGLVSGLPMIGSEMSTSLSFDILDRADVVAGEQIVAHHALADVGALATLGAPIVAGRDFRETDTAGSAPVALVDEAAARAYWPGASPIGARLRLAQSEDAVEVVGVFAELRLQFLEDEPAPTLLLPHAQAERSFVGQILGPATTVLIRAREKTDPAVASLMRHVRELEPELPLFGVETLEQHLAGLIRAERMASRAFTTASVLALGLAMLGLFATAAQSVVERTRELGIRSACGASPRDLLALVLRRAIVVASAGVVLGALAAGPLGRQVQAQLREQSTVDLGLWAAIAVCLVGFAALAALMPARRAARVDPVRSLRADV